MITRLETNQMTNEDKAKAAVAALSRKGYTGHYAATKAAAKELALSFIPVGAAVGFGGSVTTRALGLVEALRGTGHAVFDHWQPGLSRDEILDIRLKQVVSDVFLTSANAITLGGEIVNIDGLGNRVAATIFGPKCVIVIVGINKITQNLTEALERSQQVAAVYNASRLNTATPCNSTGECSDCSSPNRICNVTVIQHRRPGWVQPSIEEYHVIVVGEEIGF